MSDFGDYEAWMAASEAPMMTCGVCGDDIIWHRTHKQWEHIGHYDHEADGPGPVRGTVPIKEKEKS